MTISTDAFRKILAEIDKYDKILDDLAKDDDNVFSVGKDNVASNNINKTRNRITKKRGECIGRLEDLLSRSS